MHAPAAVAVASRAQMLAIPFATTIRRVAASRIAAWLSASLFACPSAIQSAP